MQFSYEPEFVLLGIYPREIKTNVHKKTYAQTSVKQLYFNKDVKKKTYTQMFIANLLMKAKNWKQADVLHQVNG